MQGCPSLSDLRLDRCKRITDAAFDSNQSLFAPLVACLSLESISLQSCPQLTGSVVVTLNKMCRNLKFLNLSQVYYLHFKLCLTMMCNLVYIILFVLKCKRIESSAIRQIFEHHQIISLNLSFIDGVSDDAFLLLQNPATISVPLSSGPTSAESFSILPLSPSPLQKLYLDNSTITDNSMFRMQFLSQLNEIGLSWCSGITDQGIIALTKQCPKLQYIDLKSCQITDIAMNAIARNCTLLTRLDVSGCMSVTDSGFENLVHDMILIEPNRNARNTSDRGNSNRSAVMVKGLKTLGIVWCSQLTDTTLAALKKLATLGEYEYQS